ncbi:hypothetical protein ACLOJK_006660 [Asimina triloba]
MVSSNPEPSRQLQQPSRSTDAASAGHLDRTKISTIQPSRSITDGWAGQQCVRAEIPNPNLVSVVHPNPTRQPSTIFPTKHHPADPDDIHRSQAVHSQLQHHTEQHPSCSPYQQQDTTSSTVSQRSTGTGLNQQQLWNLDLARPAQAMTTANHKLKSGSNFRKQDRIAEITNLIRNLTFGKTGIHNGSHVRKIRRDTSTHLVPKVQNNPRTQTIR